MIRLAVAGVAGVGVAVAVPAVSLATPRTSEYVALGDSYVSGPLIPLQTGQPTGCFRSDHNYPSLVQAAVRTDTFKDVSCGGATTKEMIEPQAVTGGSNPPQLDALGPDTSLVTMGIGGNDIGFGEIIQTCATISSTQPLGAACRDHYRKNGKDELAKRIAATGPKVASVLKEIAERSPDATVRVVGYPTILPDSGPGCFPLVPFSPGDVAYLRQTTKSLNGMLKREAQRADVEYVDTYRSSIGHDVCQLPTVKWVEGLIPTAPAAPVHPNAAGMRNSAKQVLESLNTGALAGS